MWFNKKKQETIPELPELPSLPDLPEVPNTHSSSFKPANTQQNLPSLPSFPPSESANRMSHAAIKSALEIPIDSSKFTREISPEQEEEKEEGGAHQERLFAPPALPEYRHQVSEKSPVFVRIDKFQAAVQNLQEIKAQVANLEAYVTEIARIKAKEEEELSSWEKEIFDIKAKLEFIDKNVFFKLDQNVSAIC